MEIPMLLSFFYFLTVPTASLVPKEMVNFMKRYSYLTDTEARNTDITEEDIKDRIRLMQKFGGLRETGILDNQTLALMSLRRCGVPDVSSENLFSKFQRFSVRPGWKKKTITYFLLNWPTNLGREVIKHAIDKAFEEWSKPVPLRFVYKNDRTADIVLSFQRGDHGDGIPFYNRIVLAHAFYPNEQLTIAGDVHFNSDQNWVVKSQGIYESVGTDVFTVAVHELGHSLGLEHSKIPGSIMAPYYKEHHPNKILDEDDIRAMYQIYVINGIFSESEVSLIIPLHSTVSVSTDIYDKITTKSLIRTTDKPIIDGCKGSFDAMTLINGELFIFKEYQMWRLRERRMILPGYPVHFNRLFRFPLSIKKIDAIYQRLTDYYIIIFTGKQFWEFTGNYFSQNSPMPLSRLGLPDYVHTVDAAMVWGKNKKTYLFRGSQYWCYDEVRKTMEPGYPRPIETWRGVPNHLDCSITWKDGQTYFFKGKYYWKFDNYNNMVGSKYSAADWLGC